ncbi:decapping and exoribonuclease protein-like [Dermacentor variabilis]|uniref:decapping and exoribonuclease protein-like n=1 Tax=Dermacentor variabilis TaxID=34621 RepID=UPI003F5B3B51
MDGACERSGVDARCHEWCVVPAGENVAALNVRDAVSSPSGDCPRYDVLCEVGHYSVRGEREEFEYIDGAALKRYLLTPIPWESMLNLNIGYTEAVRVNWITGKLAPTESLLRWVLLNRDKVVARSSNEEAPSSGLERKSMSTDFICNRRCLKEIMCTPFEEKIAWRLVACRHQGIVYIHDHPTQAEVHKCLKERGNKKLERSKYWGVKFHRSMTTTDPEVVPDEDELVREGDTYNAVLRGQLGSHSLLMATEVKAVDPSVKCESGSTAGYVEFKTNRILSPPWHRSNFYRHKLLSWWAQSRLGGVPRALCGFRDDEGWLMHIKEFDVMTMPDKAEGQWSEDVCMQFCDRLLSFIKEHVEGDDGRTVYCFEYVPSSCEVICTRLTDPGKLFALPDWFLEAFEGC